jgi:2-polyprenyl-3-methyl-5-hydroxy-6-metoxy-1,4-benzoquinol methylase
VYLTDTDDKAGKEYWDKTWSWITPVSLIDPKNDDLKNEVDLRLHRFFDRVLSASDISGKRLLEVGCARSVWLPYFARQYNLDVAGLDYSEEGCRQEEALLRDAGVNGLVVNGDLFSPPPSLLKAFDFVFSFGVVEHFQEPAKCVAALAEYLKPGGVLITIVPNMRGLVGALQRTLDRKVFDIHVPLDSGALASAHKQAGLSVISCEYLISTNFYVVNVANRRHSLIYPGLRLIYGLLGRLSMTVWMLERLIGELPSSSALSPYVICVAEKRR